MSDVVSQRLPSREGSVFRVHDRFRFSGRSFLALRNCCAEQQLTVRRYPSLRSNRRYRSRRIDECRSNFL
jgi:hypothetical protein